MADWEPYLLAHANLPGPRGNLELAAAVADAGGEAQFRRWAGLGPDLARRTRRGVSWRFAGSWGWGDHGAWRRVGARSPRPALPSPRLLTASRRETPPLRTLHTLASDPRWRIREAVAMALTLGRCGHGRPAGGDGRLGGRQPIGAARRRRGAVRAAPVAATGARGRRPAILDDITASIAPVTDRRSDEFKTLRQGLGYCWSVATAALPADRQAVMERWLESPDPDIRWIMRENLKKNRLVRMDAEWVARWRG